uniref:GMC_oxred_C domain-containing protein n=1 Tax=Steinernema glaseri TaxID=37863 RepID=A0A1I8AE55_9BILA
MCVCRTPPKGIEQNNFLKYVLRRALDIVELGTVEFLAGEPMPLASAGSVKDNVRLPPVNDIAVILPFATPTSLTHRLFRVRLFLMKWS